MALERAKIIKFGDPMDIKTDLGTVVNAKAAELFDKRVSMAEEDGAKFYIILDVKELSCHQLLLTTLI